MILMFLKMSAYVVVVVTGASVVVASVSTTGTGSL